MSRALSLTTALAGIISSPHVQAQGRVVMTPALVEANRKFTTYAPFPDYPASARARRFQGSGIYLLHLREDGTVQRVDIVQSTGHRELDEACVSAYKRWRFRQNIAAKVHKVRMPVTFANP